MQTVRLFSPTEAAAVAGIAVKAVNNAIDKRRHCGGRPQCGKDNAPAGGFQRWPAAPSFGRRLAVSFRKSAARETVRSDHARAERFASACG